MWVRYRHEGDIVLSDPSMEPLHDLSKFYNCTLCPSATTVISWIQGCLSTDQIGLDKSHRASRLPAFCYIYSSCWCFHGDIISKYFPWYQNMPQVIMGNQRCCGRSNQWSRKQQSYIYCSKCLEVTLQKNNVKYLYPEFSLYLPVIQ